MPTDYIVFDKSHGHHSDCTSSRFKGVGCVGEQCNMTTKDTAEIDAHKKTRTGSTLD